MGFWLGWARGKVGWLVGWLGRGKVGRFRLGWLVRQGKGREDRLGLVWFGWLGKKRWVRLG